jgi:hypothetical protein
LPGKQARVYLAVDFSLLLAVEREGVSQDRSPCPPRNTLIASLLLLVSTHVVGATMQFPTPPKPFRN